MADFEEEFSKAMILPIVDALIKQRMKVVLRNMENSTLPSVTVENTETAVKTDTSQSFDSGQVTITSEQEENAEAISAVRSRENAAVRNVQLLQMVSESEYLEQLKAVKKEQKMLILAVAFAAACGGMVTITGSSTNLVLLGQLSDYPGHGLNFASWFLIAFPISLVTVLLSWVWLTYYFCGVKGLRQMLTRRERGAVKSESEYYIEDECRRLGKFKFEEGCTLIAFSTLVLLWMTRDIGGIGWGKLFKKRGKQTAYVTDSQAGLLIVCLCSVIPCLSWVDAELERRDNKQAASVKHDPNQSDSQNVHSKYLLTWNDITKIIPWDILFLVGGGIAISEACKESGLSVWFGLQLEFLKAMPAWTILIFVVVVSVVLTQFISNQAVCSIMMPVLLDMAQSVNVNPLYLMFPASLASSLAFILPIASTSNAVAFATGHVTTAEMAKAGAVVNLIGILVLLAAVLTYGSAYILDPTLQWASLGNSSLVSSSNSTPFSPAML